MIGLHTEVQSLGTVITPITAAVNLILAWATAPFLSRNPVLYFLAQGHGQISQRDFKIKPTSKTYAQTEPMDN